MNEIAKWIIIVFLLLPSILFWGCVLVAAIIITSWFTKEMAHDAWGWLTIWREGRVRR